MKMEKAMRVWISAVFYFFIGVWIAGSPAVSQSTTNNWPVCTQNDDQMDPDIISDGAGGAIIAWRDQRDDGDNLYLQRMDGSGSALWTEGGVLLVDTDSVLSPKLAADGAGGAILVWIDTRDDGNGDLYVQRVNASGTSQWTTNGVLICDAGNRQQEMKIIPDGAGGAIIAWEDYRGGGDYDIYAQRVNASGIPQWTEDGVAVCTLAQNQNDPALVGDGAGGAFITWKDRRAAGIGVYVQRLNASGAPQWSSNGISIYSGSYVDEPQIISDGAAGVIITWGDLRSADYDIYAQRLDSSGAAQWTTGGVLLCNAADPQNDPQLAFDGSGGAIITWQDYRGSESDIYAQRVNSSGTPQWASNGEVLCSADDYQYYPQIVSDDDGGAIVSWEDYRGGGDCDIYAQRIDSSGTVQWDADGALICEAPNDQAYSKICTDGTNGAVIAWRDERNDGTSSDDIYAQRVYKNGAITLPVVSFAAEGQSVLESTWSTEIPVALSETFALDVSVPYTLSGTATEGAGGDYTVTESPLLIPAGSMEASVTLNVYEDADAEPDETVVITLGTPTNATLGATTVHTATILDAGSVSLPWLLLLLLD